MGVGLTDCIYSIIPLGVGGFFRLTLVFLGPHGGEKVHRGGGGGSCGG